MNVHFTRSVYKHMLGLPINVSDLESVDPQLASSLRTVIDTEDADMLCLSFVVPSATAQVFGGGGRGKSVDNDGGGMTEDDVVELVDGGSEIEVNDSNKREYVARVAHHRMTAEIAAQLRHLVAGLHEVVPPVRHSIVTSPATPMHTHARARTHTPAQRCTDHSLQFLSSMRWYL